MVRSQDNMPVLVGVLLVARE